MIPTQTNPTIDQETHALASCYQLLLQKAQERRARLEREAVEQIKNHRETETPKVNP